MELSVAHSQPTTLAANRSELSELSEPDAQSQPVPLATDRSEPSRLSEPCIQSDTDSQQELGQEIVADPALHSGQCGSSALGNCVPWTWAKNGDLVAPLSDRIWADLFDTVDSWEKYSQNLRPLLRIYYVQKEWTLVFSNSQRHFQFLGFPTSPNMGHAPHNQALLPKPTKWPLRPHGTLEPHDYTLRPNMLDPSTPYRPYIYRLKSDPPPYVSAMCSMNDGIKTPLPYYKELYRRFFVDSFTIARDWEIIAEAWKVLGIPPLPTKPHGLEKQYSVQLIEDFIWENPELSLNLLVNYAYDNRGFAEYVGAIYCFPLDPDVGSVVDDMIRRGVPVFGVQEYPSQASAAADAESAAVMKQWKVDRLQVEERVTYVVLGFRWVYEYGERIKVYDNKEDDPTFSAPKPAASSGVGDDDRMDIFGAIMGNPFDTEFDDTYDGHDEDDDYRREPSPLDPGEENAAKALISAAENGDDSARQRIELALRGAHGKKRGKSCNGKPAQSDFETALMRLWRSSTKEERQRENDARRCVKQARRAKDYAEADRSRNELEAVEKSEAEELRQEAETHVHEVEQREHEASQSRQSAPTVSSVPPPPPPPPPPPMPAPHHPPAASGSTQHAPLPLPLALPRYLLDPLHLLLDFLMSMLHALWPLFSIPPLPWTLHIHLGQPYVTPLLGIYSGARFGT
ncbi:hypothetical protein BS47DRAFT_1367443 [Hydnum rufescens UP504]|uniref:Uncharacterized protein n=1 Tax=Hydnum rufescens UP504 TaxID=1448309 RepID=A0A9P6DPJ6_9AGAM|nr:hypothetical protein BS47DRAFT_1367443 [Hydnum rufescens UP504]